MIDAVSIRHPGGTQGAFDPDLGYAPIVPFDPFYTGKAKVKPQAVQSGEQESAGQILTSLGFTISVPIAVTEARPEDIITCTASVLDPGLVGKEFRVVSPLPGTFLTARRLSCLDYQEGP